MTTTTGQTQSAAKHPPYREEFYFPVDIKWFRMAVMIHGHEIAAEATNPNTAETGVVVAFADEAAAKRFQEYLGNLDVTCRWVGEEVRDHA